MKKLMIVALMAVAASTAFAGDSPALKAILKADSYDKAKALIDSSLGQLESNAEKAKAYNKLYKLALEPVKNLKAPEGNSYKPKTTNDSLMLFEAIYKAMDAAVECDKYDMMPNEKGKVAPKYRKTVADELYLNRDVLNYAAVYYYNLKDDANTYKYFCKLVDTYYEPVFSDLKGKLPDLNIEQRAFYALLFADQLNDKSGAKYADIAVNDKELADDAITYKMHLLGKDLKTRQDSLNYVKTLEEEVNKYPNHEGIFGTLINMYSSLKMNSEMNNAFEQKLKTDPDNFVVWAVKGQNAMFDQKLEEAIECYKKALKSDPENAQILTYCGASQLDLGNAIENEAAGTNGRVPNDVKAKTKPLFEEALVNLEKAKQLDPNREKANWAYPLFRCYYTLYGDSDPRTKAAAADAGVND